MEEFLLWLTRNKSDWYPRRCRFNPWPHSVGWGSSIVMSCGLGHSHSLDLVLLWLWYRPETTAQIWFLAWEPPYAKGSALKKTKKKKNLLMGPLLLQLWFLLFLTFSSAWDLYCNSAPTSDYWSYCKKDQKKSNGNSYEWRPSFRALTVLEYCQRTSSHLIRKTSQGIENYDSHCSDGRSDDKTSHNLPKGSQ